MKIIDAHNHPDWHGHSLEKYLANMDANNIDQTWLLNWECPRHEYNNSYEAIIPAPLLGTANGPIPFQLCVSYKERAPERFVLGYAPDPRQPDALDCLKAAVQIYGAQVCGELKVRTCYDSPSCLRMFRLCGELQLPVILHMQYDLKPLDDYTQTQHEWWGGTIESFERAIAACPDTIFLGHAPGFWIHISDDDLYTKTDYPPEGAKVVPGGKLPEMLRKYPNLYCDMSAGSGCRALSRDPEFAKSFLLEFQDRILYARDYFDSAHQDFLKTLDLSVDVQEKIYHKNAEKLLEKA